MGDFLRKCYENYLLLAYVKGPRAGPGPLGPRAPGILPPLPPPLDGPVSTSCQETSHSYAAIQKR
ncbi:unnamed protein product [Nesidiocoris tenuis]|uniref:Uncharacterized protein n=1 Tax=Nesidiocoris tenuis TaxID=355587 RepID=A0A6H5HTJ9_9HEMI|nr:unnamed protein product [Nesidiocoris tenuis]